MRARLAIVLVVLSLWGVAVAARLYQLQVVDHEKYSQRAAGQHRRRVELQPPRGTIFDARGRKLAISVDVDSVWADPSQVAEPAAAAKALASVLPVQEARLREQLSSDREFVWIARQLAPDVATAARQLNLKGVGFLKESKRFYPMRQLASQVVGFAGLDNNGLEGLEQTYNDVVAGQPVERTVLRDARRGTVLLPAYSFRDVEPGQDLHLTIDAWIQHLLEKELLAAVERTKAKSASAVVLDPNSGAIYAMASYPMFDANFFGQTSRESWRNRAVMDAFEPGSIFKMVTAAAALEANLVDPSDVFDCENGSIVVRGVRIHDHKSFGRLTFREILAKSSNVGAIKTGMLVGDQGLYQQIVKFGFGRPTEVDLPGESPGIFRAVENWPKRAGAYLSFGQNISVTSLQMASSFAAVANGGTLYRPYVVSGLGRNGRIESTQLEGHVLGRPISTSTARSLGRILEAVVEEGTGKRAAFPGYRAAGKTGTAQKASPTGGYAARKFVASFVGFAPARDPRVVAMIAVDEPEPSLGYHGGAVAAPVFSAVVGPTLLYLGVSPDREQPETWPSELIAQEENQPVEDSAAQEAALASASPTGLPDFSGLTARQAVKRSAELGLRASIHGRGNVSQQAPAPGTELDFAAGRLELWLASDAGR